MVEKPEQKHEVCLITGLVAERLLAQHIIRSSAHHPCRLSTNTLNLSMENQSGQVVVNILYQALLHFGYHNLMCSVDEALVCLLERSLMRLLRPTLIRSNNHPMSHLFQEVDLFRRQIY